LEKFQLEGGVCGGDEKNPPKRLNRVQKSKIEGTLINWIPNLLRTGTGVRVDMRKIGKTSKKVSNQTHENECVGKIKRRSCFGFGLGKPFRVRHRGV